MEGYHYFLVCLQIYAMKFRMYKKDNGWSKKRVIDQSITQLLINQLFDKINDQSIIIGDLLLTEGAKEKKEMGVGFRNVVGTWLGG